MRYTVDHPEAQRHELLRRVQKEIVQIEYVARVDRCEQRLKAKHSQKLQEDGANHEASCVHSRSAALFTFFSSPDNLNTISVKLWNILWCSFNVIAPIVYMPSKVGEVLHGSLFDRCSAKNDNETVTTNGGATKEFVVQQTRSPN